MKTQQNTQKPAEQPVFHKVAENLYRLESSNGYYALIKKAGKQFRRSLRTKDRKLAERRLKELKAQIGVLTVAKDDAKLTFKEVADAWNDATKHSIEESSETRRKTCIQNLADYFKDMAIRNITVRDCEQWAAKRGAEAAAQTFAHELGVMKSTFKYALKHGFILSNPAAEIKRKKISNCKIQTPSRDQFQQIVAQIRFSDGREDSQEKSKDGADLVEFLAYSGARVGEAQFAIWKDAHFDTGEIWIHGKKSEASDRLIPMSKALRLFLERLKKETNPKLSDSIIKVKSAKRSLARACKKLELPIFTHHDFRHYFATTCIEEGVDIPTVSRWLGHADGGALAMKRYGHSGRERKGFKRADAAYYLSVSLPTLDRLTQRGLLRPSRALRHPIYSKDESRPFFARNRLMLPVSLAFANNGGRVRRRKIDFSPCYPVAPPYSLKNPRSRRLLECVKSVNSIHKSIRFLLSLGLSRSNSATPQTITRTVKFKINTDIQPELIPLLNTHFNAFEQFRRKVLDELAALWKKDQKTFEAMVKCSGQKPYEDKTSCYAWLHALAAK